MLCKCPSCGARIRITELQKQGHFRYFCLSCEQIVLLNVAADQILDTSSPDRAKDVPRTLRILVVDDSFHLADLVSAMLTREGYAVITASDGLEALKKIIEERPDLVILDLFMPRMTGFEVLRAVRTNAGYRSSRDVPILVMSGIYNPAEVEIIHDLGANGFISKDSLNESLVYRVKKLLNEPSRPA
jgi:CheY-like chemotaxis protein